MGKAAIEEAPPLFEYLLDVSLRESDAARALRERTAEHVEARMQITPEQGQFMALLAKLAGARKCVEIGTFTGYSALVVAEALPADGRIVACDVSEEWTSVGRPYWERAGVAEKIDLRIGPGAETLERLLSEGEGGSFDFAFIDADKSGYDTYYEHCLELLRPGGLIALDNMLWGGKVIDPDAQDSDTRCIRALNEKIRDDARVDASFLMVGDGLYLARKR